MPHSPISARSSIRIPTTRPLFSSPKAIQVGPLWINRDAPRLVPQYFLQAKAVAVDLIVPLLPKLVSVVQVERLDLAYEMIEFLRAEP